jgi:hypothetical protein
MRNDKNTKDPWKDWFASLPEKKLTDDFRERLMERVAMEAARMKKREERVGLLVTVLLALVILLVGGLAFVYLEIPMVRFRMPDWSLLPFLIYIGGLVFLLLLLDHKFRRYYEQKHSK